MKKLLACILMGLFLVSPVFGADLVTDGGFDAVTDNVGELSSGYLTIGKCYKISARATYPFTTVGSPDNVIGTYFVATGVGSQPLDSANKVFPVTFTNWTEGTGWAPEASGGVLTSKAQKIAGTANNLVPSGAGILTANTMYQTSIVFTVDAGNVRPYFNGVPGAWVTTSSTDVQNVRSDGTSFFIQGDSTFAGTVDSVAVYPRRTRTRIIE